MKADILLIIFLIIWVGVVSYLFFLDRQVKKLKQKLFFHDELKKEHRENL